MLIHCPKCGFQQPTDKYCAQCGVDIENFKPQLPSQTKKIFTNPLLQLSVLVLVTAAAGISFYQDQKNKAALLPTTAPRTLQVNSNASTGVTAAVASADTVEQASTQNFAATSEDGSASDPTDSAENAVGAGTTGAVAPTTQASPSPTETPAAARAGTPHMVIYYAEVTNQELQGLFELSQNTGQFMSFGDYTAGILPGIEKRITPSNLNIKVLHKEDRTLESKAAPLRFTYGKANAGLELVIEAADFDASTFRGNMEVRRTWVESNGGANPESSRKSFPANIELTSTAGFFISGVLPRKTSADNDNELTSMNLFRILRSPAFQRRDSEFVIFIEFDRNN